MDISTDHGFWIVFSQDYPRTNLEVRLTRLQIRGLVGNVLRMFWIDFSKGRVIFDDLTFENAKAVNDFGLVIGQTCTMNKVHFTDCGGDQKSILTI